MTAEEPPDPEMTALEVVAAAGQARTDAVLAALGPTPTVIKQSTEYGVLPGSVLPTGERLLAVRVDRELSPPDQKQPVGTQTTTVWGLLKRERHRTSTWQILYSTIADPHETKGLGP